MRLDEAVKVDEAIRFWQARALKYEQALRGLGNTTAGIWSYYEADLRMIIGHTNYSVVLHHIENARVALDKPDQM